jgi:hypothetical protein
MFINIGHANINAPGAGARQSAQERLIGPPSPQRNYRSLVQRVALIRAKISKAPWNDGLDFGD